MGPENTEEHIAIDGSEEGTEATIIGNANSVYEVLARATKNQKHGQASTIMLHRGVDGSHCSSHRRAGDPSSVVRTPVV